MKCYSCGGDIPAKVMTCPACGHSKSRLVYVRPLAIVGGLVGSFVGYSLDDVLGALLGGLLGIVATEIAARLMLQPRKVQAR